MQSNEALINGMIGREVLFTQRIIDAFEAVDRKYFVPEPFSEYTYVDAPLPIGNDQTISQPSTVAFMLELLEPKEGEKILDIGSGSGWTTALLCHIVGESGEVLGVERVERLAQQGKENLKKLGYGEHCRIDLAEEGLGRPGELFDRILVSASSDEIPEELFEQLLPGGILVIPVKNSIFRFKKFSQEHISKEEYPGFRFVPLIY
jgi:protein-L-isoaspartate(D-aspartate) O-methyltransferase